MNVAPVSCTTRSRVASRAARVGAQYTMLPPYPATAAFFTAGALSGMTMYAGTPRKRAANATAAAWLPEECVATPYRASCSERPKTALHAPRNLKAPTFWKFSHLQNSAAPTRSFKLVHVSTGVQWTYGLIRVAAACTSASVVYGVTSPPSTASTYGQVPTAGTVQLVPARCTVLISQGWLSDGSVLERRHHFCTKTLQLFYRNLLGHANRQTYRDSLKPWVAFFQRFEVLNDLLG